MATPLVGGSPQCLAALKAGFAGIDAAMRGSVRASIMTFAVLNYCLLCC
jgi:hypothetical protein